MIPFLAHDNLPSVFADTSVFSARRLRAESKGGAAASESGARADEPVEIPLETFQSRAAELQVDARRSIVWGLGRFCSRGHLPGAWRLLAALCSRAFVNVSPAYCVASMSFDSFCGSFCSPSQI